MQRATSSVACPSRQRLAIVAGTAAIVRANLVSLPMVSARSLHEKPMRLFETPRLRTVRKWEEFAPYIASIKFTFDPAVTGTTASKELWRQAAGRAIRQKYPKYTVELNETDDWGKCEVAVAYANGRSQVIPALHCTLLDIYDVMSEVTEEIYAKEEKEELEKG